ncbi:hypothetical protein HDU91_002396, partial [Kappamyces sp. JEL0680]
DPENKRFKVRYGKSGWRGIAFRYVQTIVQNKETRNVFFFLLLNISFTVVEFLYGWWNNSLGLTSDAVHMLFDSTAIIFSLIASVITKWDANINYSYGFGRVETLTGFINALALVFASGNIMWEAFERLFFEAEELKTDNLLLVSVLGLLVNIGLPVFLILVGIFAFDHGGHSHGGHDHSHSHDHGHSLDHGQNPLMHGMFLHILADALGSVGVIISSLLIEYFGWNWSDPVCSIFISVLTFAGAWPLLKKSGEILLQRSPRALDSQLPRAMQQVMSLHGVLGFSKQHFWELNQGEYVGSIVVQVSQGADDQSIQMTVQNIFRPLAVTRLTVEIQKDVVSAY